MFNDKSILITGGTGSFGKQYTETLLKPTLSRPIFIFFIYWFAIKNNNLCYNCESKTNLRIL